MPLQKVTLVRPVSRLAVCCCSCLLRACGAMGAVLARLFGHGEGGAHRRMVLGEHTVAIERQLAVGGFSTVYLVRDTSDVLGEHNKQHAAAPMLVLKELICPTEERLSFARTEASVLRAVKHHNVIRLLDSAEIGDRVYLLLPFFEVGWHQSGIEHHGAMLTVIVALSVIAWNVAAAGREPRRCRGE